jgi:dihydrofolate reductase
MIALIAAMSENRVIGRGNRLPWHMPADLKRFKRLTTGHAVIMGRRTFESMKCRPLPNRTNIVLTRQPGFHAAENVQIARSLDEALDLARSAEKNGKEIFILGGSEIFEQALPRADRIYLTVIHAAIPGDAYFPEIDSQQWALIDEERHDADERNADAYSFRVYERKRT